MNNGNWRGPSTGSSSYKSEQPAGLDEFVSYKENASLEEKKKFSDGVNALLKGDFKFACSIFLSLIKAGNQKNPAVKHNLILSRKKNRNS